MTTFPISKYFLNENFKKIIYNYKQIHTIDPSDFDFFRTVISIMTGSTGFEVSFTKTLPVYVVPGKTSPSNSLPIPCHFSARSILQVEKIYKY